MREYHLRNQEVAAQRAYTEELSRHTRALEAQRLANDPLVKQVMASVHGPRRLELTAGTTLDFYEIVRDRISLHSLKKRFKIKIENPNPTKTISGIKLSIFLEVAPLDPAYRFPWLLLENGSIDGGDHTSVPFAVYEERREPEKYPGQEATSDTFEVQSLRSDRLLLLGIENEYTFHVRCTANDLHYSDAKFKISVTEGRFQVEKL